MKQLRRSLSGNAKVDKKTYLEISFERVKEKRDSLKLQATQLTDELGATRK